MLSLDTNGILERFNGTARDESEDDYGDNCMQAQAIIAKLIADVRSSRG